ncbi:hypothetical protein NFI96_014981 [Prochilodus magdalenae]|nr:hypothetical protein NFI96_014981 [Prochilodus magdalenae]
MVMCQTVMVLLRMAAGHLQGRVPLLSQWRRPMNPFCNQIFPASCVSGASGTGWSVKYNQQEICALNGSTVFMNGSYTHPEHLTVNQTFWIKDPVRGKDLIDLSKDPGYSGRVKYLADEQKHFSLRLSDVMKTDEHQYSFRIITNVEKEKWVGNPGVQLRVTDLHVETPGEVTEGETAVLTCRTTCSLTDPTFIWYKNGRPLTTKTIKNNQLHLQPVSSEDAGRITKKKTHYQNADPNAMDDMCTALQPTASSYDDVSHTLSAVQSSSPDHTYTALDPQTLSSPAYESLAVSSSQCKRENRIQECNYENADPNAKEDTYTALQPTARSSDDVYHTLGAVQSGSPDDTYTALDPQFLSSPEYETLAVSYSQCPVWVGG